MVVMSIILVLLSVAIWWLFSAINGQKETADNKAPPAPVATNVTAQPPVSPEADKPAATAEPRPASPIKNITNKLEHDAIPPELEKELLPEPPPTIVEALDEPLQAPEITQALIEEVPEVEAAAPTPTPDGPDPKIAEYVQSIQIRGVGRGKVLLYIPGTIEAEAYAPGSLLNCDIELRLKSIEQDYILINDAKGRTYRKAR